MFKDIDRQWRAHIDVALYAVAVFCVAIFIYSLCGDYSQLEHVPWIMHYFLATQDRWPLLALAGVMASVAIGRHHLNFISLPEVRVPAWAVIGLMAVVVACCAYVGRAMIMDHLNYAWDEYLADFDAKIYASGHLMMPLASQWQAFYNALNPHLMLQVDPPSYVVSLYLPMHALLRAGWGLVADPEWLSPVLAALSVICIFRIARLLWPDDVSVAVVVSLLLATSTQFLFIAMTTFAMTAHLLANCLWLLCFMRRDQWGWWGCLLISFIACGLHQIAFHVMFVAPFIFTLFRANRKTADLLLVGYVIIILFWTNYPQMLTSYMGVEREISAGNGSLTFVVVVAALLSKFSVLNIVAMLVNAARLMVWQNPALIVFLICAWSVVRTHKDDYMRELCAGIVLMLIVLFFVVPYQAWGWGYRYQHMFLLNYCLLAGCGWRWLCQNGQKPFAHIMLIGGSLYAVAFSFPFFAQKAQNLNAIMRREQNLALSSSADVVVVDTLHLRLSYAISRNEPDLSNHPLMMDLDKLSLDNINELCAHKKLALFDKTIGVHLGDIEDNEPAPEADALLKVLAEHHCAPPLRER